MKHLVKKYVRSAKVGQDVADVINSAIDEKRIKEIADNNMEGYVGWVQTYDNEIIQTFKFNENGKMFLIPEPNPIVIYFDTARFYIKTILDKRNKLFAELNNPKKNVHTINAHFYTYYSTACNSAIFLFLSIEAFINKKIEKKFEYRKEIQNKKTELYNKYQIQRNIEFTEKIKEVMPQATGKNFVVEFTHKYEYIRKLKHFRDEIVHTKSLEDENIPNYYEELYVMSLNFEYEKTMLSIRDYINFYEPNLLEECDCGRED